MKITNFVCNFDILKNKIKLRFFCVLTGPEMLYLK